MPTAPSAPEASASDLANEANEALSRADGAGFFGLKARPSIGHLRSAVGSGAAGAGCGGGAPGFAFDHRTDLKDGGLHAVLALKIAAPIGRGAPISRETASHVPIGGGAPERAAVLPAAVEPRNRLGLLLFQPRQRRQLRHRGG